MGRFFGDRGFGLRFAMRRGPLFGDVGREGGRKEGDGGSGGCGVRFDLR